MEHIKLAYLQFGFLTKKPQLNIEVAYVHNGSRSNAKDEVIQRVYEDLVIGTQKFHSQSAVVDEDFE